MCDASARRNLLLRRLALVGLALLGCEGRAELLGVVQTRVPSQPVFGVPVAIAELNTPDFKEQDMTLTDDLLETVFMSERTGRGELWASTRASRTSPWEPPHLVTELNTDKSEIKPSISGDGLRIWFYSGATPSGIWYSSRASRTSPWQPATPIVPFAGAGVHDPAQDEDELLMAVTVLAAGTGAWDVYTSTRPDWNTEWSTLAPLTSVNGPTDEHDPIWVHDGRDIFLSSKRTGLGDLYWQRRPSATVDFPELLPLTELNQADAYESDPFLSADHGTFFFASTRSGVCDMFEVPVLSYPPL